MTLLNAMCCSLGKQPLHVAEPLEVNEPVKANYKEILKQNKWMVNEIVGLDTGTQTYKLIKYEVRTKFAGNQFQLLDSIHFQSDYSSWCGNDYFTDVLGKYTFIDVDKIALTAETITYSGEWDKPEEHRSVNYIHYRISNIGDTLLLTKQSD